MRCWRRHAFFSIFYVLFCASSSLAGERGKVELYRSDGTILTFPMIQSAVDAANAGDRVRLSAGVYNESVLISNKFGTEKAKITLEGPEGGNAIISGAHPRVTGSANSKPFWTKQKDGFWYANFPWRGQRDRSTVAWSSIRGDALLASYHDIQTLKRHPRGDGVYRYGEDVYLFLENGKNPNDIEIVVPQFESPLVIERSSHVTISGLTIENGGYAGVFVKPDSSDIEIQSLLVKNSFKGISVEGSEASRAKRVSIDRCTVVNDWNFSWSWEEGYSDVLHSSKRDEDAPMRGVGIALIADDSSVRFSEVAGQWDGMRVQGKKVSVTGNLIHHVADDAIELESGLSEYLDFSMNLIFDVFVGVSVGSNSPGPVYIHNNKVYAKRLSRHVDGMRYGYPLKFGVDWGIGIKKLYIYNNTFFSGGRSVFVKGEGVLRKEWSDVGLVNNIFVTEQRGAIGFESFGDAAHGVHVEGNFFSRSGDLKTLYRKEYGFKSPGRVVGLTGDIGMYFKYQESVPSDIPNANGWPMPQGVKSALYVGSVELNNLERKVERKDFYANSTWR